MKISNRALFSLAVLGIVGFYSAKPIKKAVASKPFFNDIYIEMFNNTNTTVVGDVGDIQGDFNVKN